MALGAQAAPRRARACAASSDSLGIICAGAGACARSQSQQLDQAARAARQQELLHRSPMTHLPRQRVARLATAADLLGEGVARGAAGVAATRAHL